jgi:hypothetical protein
MKTKEAKGKFTRDKKRKRKGERYRRRGNKGREVIKSRAETK